MFHIYLKKNYPAITLKSAMHYAVTNGGKRMRPLLVYATGLTQDVPFEILDLPATAIELIHSYSLIHDDLPAMDDADLRRGKPTCHKAFNDAVAILAGDALQPLAFEIIASHEAKLSAVKRLAMIKTLAEASGINGMAGGQALDMEGVSSKESLTQMYSLKTGALIRAAVQLGIDASHSAAPTLLEFANHLGFAFQLQDDLLDFASHENITGKTTGKDFLNDKMTYARFEGIEKTQIEIETHYSIALKILAEYGNKALILRQLTEYLFQRKK
ncbi:MAG TPA: farnesyl diphosphate synthase [Gammaproteobacteria bacterium]|nr:farnesyl diphosphate synthase [Gammaproteobacteria bacterium]